jgi:hypothetical protein
MLLGKLVDCRCLEEFPNSEFQYYRQFGAFPSNEMSIESGYNYESDEAESTVSIQMEYT